MEKVVKNFGLIFLGMILLLGVVSASVSVQINSPNDNEWLSSELNSFSYNASTDSDDLDKCWFNLNSGENVFINCGATSYDFADALGNGDYNLRLSANDTGSRSDWKDIDFSIDTISPIINITSPVNGENIAEETTEIVFKITESNLKQCKWSNDGGETKNLFECSEGENTLSYSNNQEGNQVIIYVEDLAGNSENDLVGFFVDSIYPNITINAPSENPAYLSQNYFDVVLNVIETNPSRLLFNVIDSGESKLVNRTYTNGTNQTFRYPDGTEEVEEGIYNYSLTATDLFNHESIIQGIVYLDTTPPTIQINSPQNNSFVSGIIEIQTTTDDGEGSGVPEDGVLIELINESVNLEISSSFDTTAFADGNYTIKATTYDKATNSNFSDIMVIIDNTKPEIADLQITPNPTKQGQVNISITLVEENLNYSTKPIIEINNLTSSYSITETGFANNQWSGTLIINDDNEERIAEIIVNGFTDLAENIMDENSDYTFNVDTLEPYISEIQDFSSLKISPKNQDGFLDEVNVDLKFSETSSAVIYIENEEGEIVKEVYSSSSVTNPQSKSWNGTNQTGEYVADGSYHVKVNLTDMIGNTNHSIMVGMVKVDNTAPILEEVTQIQTPTNDNTPEYKFNSTEKGNITYFNCPANLEEAVSGNNTIILNGLEDGNYSNCIIQVNDEAGNIGENLTITEFVIDTTAPVVSVNELTTNDNTPLITGNIDDINAKVNISLNEVNYSATINDEGAWEVQIDSELNDGIYEVIAIATDEAGNKGTNQTNLTIDTTPPELSFIDGVEQGPVLTDTIVINYSDTTTLNKKYTFVKEKEHCDAELISVMNNYAGGFNVSNEDYNDFYVCVYGEDELGNSKFITSENVFNIDRTAPELSFIDGVEQGPVLEDLINISFGDAVIKKYGFAGGDSNCADVAVNNYTQPFVIDNESVNGLSLYVYGEDSLGNYGCLVSENVFNIDVSAPIINVLNAPQGVYNWDNRVQGFQFGSGDFYSEVDNCILDVNEQEFMLDYDPEVGFINASTYTAGTHTWQITCNDTLGNTNSTSGQFTILENQSNSNEFNQSTDLTNVPDISNVTYFYVNNSNGMINFTEAINFSSGFDWSQFIRIFYGLNKWGENTTTIYVNSSGELNKPGTLVFRGINFTRPEVMKDNLTRVCSAESCYDYNSTTGVLIINVNGFTEYTVREYQSPPTTTTTSSGGGGGGSSYWKCTQWGDWSECVDGQQERDCVVKEKTNYLGKTIVYEKRDCIILEENSETQTQEEQNETQTNENIQNTPITGGVVGAISNNKGLVAATFIAMIAAAGIGLIVYRRYR